MCTHSRTACSTSNPVYPHKSALRRGRKQLPPQKNHFAYSVTVRYTKQKGGNLMPTNPSSCLRYLRAFAPKKDQGPPQAPEGGDTNLILLLKNRKNPKPILILLLKTSTFPSGILILLLEKPHFAPQIPAVSCFVFQVSCFPGVDHNLTMLLENHIAKLTT